jgi:hypothetical protein
MAHMHTHILSHSVCLEDPLLGRNAVYMHSTVTTLGGDELVHWIPRNALDIVVMLREFPDAGPIRNAEDTSSIIRTTGNHVFARRAPSNIIDFVCRATVDRLTSARTRARSSLWTAHRKDMRTFQCSGSSSATCSLPYVAVGGRSV